MPATLLVFVAEERELSGIAWHGIDVVERGSAANERKAGMLESQPGGLRRSATNAGNIAHAFLAEERELSGIARHGIDDVERGPAAN